MTVPCLCVLKLLCMYALFIQPCSTLFRIRTLCSFVKSIYSLRQIIQESYFLPSFVMSVLALTLSCQKTFPLAATSGRP